MPHVAVTEYHLRLTRELRACEATQLRGFFGRAFSEHKLLHQHGADGKPIYEYPRVQFKVFQRQAVLIGLGEGSTLLDELWPQVDHVRLQGEELGVREATLRKRQEPFGESDELVTYRFITPCLALNETNVRRYRGQESPAARQQVLDEIVVGNCLAFAKVLSHRVQDWLTGDCSRLHRVQDSRVRGMWWQSFMGLFRVNFVLPDHVGLGKWVSRGYGTLVREG
ncbi:MAG: CRISPR-associated endonuclease Cas6 [Candidatus Latescibacterota bacterium]